MSNNHTPLTRARELRRNMTEEEKKLWQKLRGRKFLGLKFFRQHPITYERINNQPIFFIPDFYCAKEKLIIEIDGKIHDFRKEYDKRREEILSNAGYRILRFKNVELTNIYEVLKRIEEFVNKSKNSP